MWLSARFAAARFCQARQLVSTIASDRSQLSSGVTGK
jgi:hypothetical protein